jgi:hypothetical protein
MKSIRQIIDLLESIQEVNPVEDDKYNLIDYLGLDPDEDSFEFSPPKEYPISAFEEQIKKESKYWMNDPEDKERVEFIMSLLQQGKPLYPVIAMYSSQDKLGKRLKPPRLYVMEGHHRLQAAYTLGIKNIPVIEFTQLEQ